MKTARELHQRANELERSEMEYRQLVHVLDGFFQRLGHSEFGGKIDRAVLTRAKSVLEDEILPERRKRWSEYVRLFGFAWDDLVRIENGDEPPLELAPTHMNFGPYALERFAWIHGRAIKADGQPGKKIVVAKLQPGTTKVTVLSAAKTPTDSNGGVHLADGE